LVKKNSSLRLNAELRSSGIGFNIQFGVGECMTSI